MSFDLAEYQALRDEIMLRVRLQNHILMLVMVMFPVLGAVMAAWPQQTFELALAYVGAVGMGSLIWLHSGARTVQIKAYVTEVLEPRLRDGGGWEAWHARHRIGGVLGSRWFISTRGVFIGAQLAAAALALFLSSAAFQWSPVVVLVLATPVVTAVLLTKPKMASKESPGAVI